MDFIERLFHLAPDGGNGALEAVYAVCAAAAVATLAFRRRIVNAAKALMSASRARRRFVRRS